MGRPKNYWYPTAREMIRHYPILKKDNSPQAIIFTQAIEKVLKQTEAEIYGDLRVKAINMLYFAKTHTFAGTAQNLHVSERMLQMWTSEFINAVGEEAGFKRAE